MLFRSAGGLAAYIAANPDQVEAAKNSVMLAGMVGAVKAFKGMPESVLLEAARRGDNGAFTELYQQTSSQLRRSLHGFERQGINVDDVMQRTYEKFFNALKRDPNQPGGFRGDSKVSTFLHRIAQNEAMHRWETEKPHLTAEPLDTPVGAEGKTLADTLGHEETPEKAMLNADLSAQMSAALDRLDPQIGRAHV